MVVNSREGEASNMARRARSLARRLSPEFTVDVLVAPAMSILLAGIRRSDAVYVIDPGRIGFPAWVLARIMGRPIFTESGDPQAALYRTQGRGPASIAMGAAIDGMVARASTGLVVRGRHLAEILRVTVPWIEVPDGVELERFRPTAASDVVRERLGISPSTPVVGVLGSLAWSERFGMAYGWDLIEALSHPGTEQYRAMIVGDGSGLASLRGLAQSLSVDDRVIFTGRVSYDDAPAYICAMDVCVSTQSNDAVGRSRTTAKLPEYLACDRFVLATDVGGASDVLPGEMLMPYEGVKDKDHPRRLAIRLGELAPRQRQLRIGAGTRALAERNFSYEVLGHRMAKFVQGLVDEQPAEP
jgi:glycosyltransferase involved in cell wall biosynthesis